MDAEFDEHTRPTFGGRGANAFERTFQPDNGPMVRLRRNCQGAPVGGKQECSVDKGLIWSVRLGHTLQQRSDCSFEVRTCCGLDGPHRSDLGSNSYRCLRSGELGQLDGSIEVSSRHRWCRMRQGTFASLEVESDGQVRVTDERGERSVVGENRDVAVVRRRPLEEDVQDALMSVCPLGGADAVGEFFADGLVFEGEPGQRWFDSLDQGQPNRRLKDVEDLARGLADDLCDRRHVEFVPDQRRVLQQIRGVFVELG